MVVARQAAVGKRKPWVPDRQDIIWIDCNPQVGREMRDVHPFLVFSPRIFNENTSLVIGLPMTTAEYNADNLFAVAVGGKHQGARPDKPATCFVTNPSLSIGVCARPKRTRSELWPTLCLRKYANG